MAILGRSESKVLFRLFIFASISFFLNLHRMSLVYLSNSRCNRLFMRFAFCWQAIFCYFIFEFLCTFIFHDFVLTAFLFAPYFVIACLVCLMFESRKKQQKKTTKLYANEIVWMYDVGCGCLCAIANHKMDSASMQLKQLLLAIFVPLSYYRRQSFTSHSLRGKKMFAYIAHCIHWTICRNRGKYEENKTIINRVWSIDL